MQTFDAQATRQALGFQPLIAALARMFASGCVVPARHHHAVGAGMTSLLMPAWLPGRYLGVKIVNIAPANGAAGLPAVHASYQLFDAGTGVALAQIDGNEITARRTAAVSALAASHLARPDATTLLVVGSGRVAALLPQAYRAVRPIQRVLVWSRRHAAATALADRWCADGLAASAVTDLASAAARADIVSCATLATLPLVQGRWLASGTHLDLIGSFTPDMREADDDCFVHSAVWVDTDDALHKSGDLLHPIARGVLPAAALRGTLADLCRSGPGPLAAGATTGGRTVFKSVGTALADLAAAVQVYEQAAG